MTRCPKCGQESPNQARFCRNCGAPLTTDGEAAAPVSPAQSPEQRAQRLLEEAFRLSEQGRVLAAIQTCQQVIAINPNSTSAHSLLGTLYERQGDREKAIRAYEQVLSLSPESTVERRRLNELMGVPTAREGVSVSPRTARLVLTGSSLLVAVIVIAAIMFTGNRTPQQPNQPQAATREQSGGRFQTAQIEEPSLPAPGRTYLGESPLDSAAAPPPAPALPTPIGSAAAPPAPAPTGPTYGYAESGARRYYSGGAGTPAPPPIAGAVPYSNRATPVVEAQGWTPTQIVNSTPQTARGYYLQGDYQQAVDAYQTYIEQHPAAGGAPREELGWVYMEMGNRGQALQQYQQAASSYQSDLERNHNAEAAKHGLRTCEAAIKALQSH